MPHFHARYYYHADRSTLKWDGEGEGHPIFPFSDYSYRVSLTQLDSLVDNALRRAGFPVCRSGAGHHCVVGRRGSFVEHSSCAERKMA